MMRGKLSSKVVLVVALFAPALMFGDNASICDTLGSANLVRNCGFETGDFTDWIVAAPDIYTEVVGDGYSQGPNSGTSFASFGSATAAVLGQELSAPTVIGQEYTFSFWLANDGATPNEFAALWGGNTVFEAGDLPYMPYTLESFSVTGTGGPTGIEFIAANPNGSFGLDDVEVTVPEPSLVGFGFLLLVSLFGIRSRRARAS